jgi:hypothetical protein
MKPDVTFIVVIAKDSVFPKVFHPFTGRRGFQGIVHPYALPFESRVIPWLVATLYPFSK